MPPNPPLERIATTSPLRISGARSARSRPRCYKPRVRHAARCRREAAAAPAAHSPAPLPNGTRPQRSTSSATARLRASSACSTRRRKRVRPRLKNRPQTCPGITRAQRLQRSRNRCRMMREVVDDGDAIHLSFHFQAPLYALERLKRSRDLLFCDAIRRGHRRSRRCVPHVVLAGQAETRNQPTVYLRAKPTTEFAPASNFRFAMRHPRVAPEP
jgi:hypothetical protein